MPLPLGLGRFNARVANHLTRPPARLLPGFAVVIHRGRRTGREYRTPVNLFRDGERYVIALTYTSRAQWVRNVLAAGGCELETRRHRLRLCAPRLVRDDRRSAMPVGVRQLLGLLRVDEFLLLDPCPRCPRLARPCRPSPQRDLTATREGEKRLWCRLPPARTLAAFRAAIAGVLSASPAACTAEAWACRRRSSSSAPLTRRARSSSTFGTWSRRAASTRSWSTLASWGSRRSPRT